MSSSLLTLALTLISDPTLWFGTPVRLDTFSDPTIGNADIASNSADKLAVLWDGRNAADPMSIWSSTSLDGGYTWGVPCCVSDQNASPFAVRICSDATGVLHAVWEDYRGPEPYAAYYSRSTDGGATWLQPNVRISIEGARCTLPAIACSEEGDLLACVYRNWEDNGRMYSSRSTDGGLNWDIGTAVGDDTEPQYSADIIWTGGQSFVAAWIDYRPTGDNSTIYCSRSEDGGLSWLHPNIPIPSGGYGIESRSVRAGFDGAVLHLTWTTQFWTDAIHSYVYYQQSSDGGLSWLPSPRRVDDGDEDWRRFGGVFALSGGPVFASWCEYTGLEYPSYALCSMSLDGGTTWSATPAVANPGTGEANTCALSGNQQDGSVYMCWNNQITGGVFFARGDAQESSPEDPDAPASWITVTPSPTSGQVYIEIPDGTTGQVQIIDTAGRLVASLEAVGSGTDLIWDSSGSPAGVYTVRLQSGAWSSTAKVVVLH